MSRSLLSNTGNFQTLKIYKSRLTHVIILAIALLFASDAQASADPLENALANERFQQLYNFLEQQGYSVEHEEITVTAVEEFAPVNTDVKVTLVPLTSSTSDQARITFWEGHWNGRYHIGGLATIGERNIFLFTEGTVQPLEDPAELEGYVGFPLYAVSGSIPYGMPAERVSISPATAAVFSDATLDAGQSLTTSGCKTVYVERNQYSILGFLLYTFNMSKYFCYNGSSVYNTSVSNWASNVDSVWHYRGIVASSDYPITNGHLSMRQGEFEGSCIQGSCLQAGYPGIEIKVYADGTFQNRSWD